MTEKGSSVEVILAGHPKLVGGGMNLLTLTWRRMTGEWRTLVEQRVSLADLSALMQQVSVPYFGFYFMLALAVVIATFGLLANSAPTIIGAMIIAPLMAPIISLSFGIVVTDRPLILRSIITVSSGVILVVLLAYGCTMILGLRIAGSEILSRSFPTLLDLGVAMAAGAAAAFAHTRRSIMTSIAGVAIAVALVPPLTVVGIGLAQGQAVSADVGSSLRQLGLAEGGEDIAEGAFLLFITNLAGIIVLASMVFLAHGYGKWRRAALSLVTVTVLSLGLLYPLGASLKSLHVKSQTLSLIAQLQHKYPKVFTLEGGIDTVAVRYRGKVVHVIVHATANRDLLESMQSRVDVVQKHLEQSLQQPVRIKLQVTFVDTLEFEAGPKPDDSGVEGQ
jgi:uncharacterized hydrophobic protein (TIGR00271 family)